MRLPLPVSFDWNQGNIDKNWKSHRVHFKEAEEVFFNKPVKIYQDKKHSYKEKRYALLGMTNKKRLLFIIFTVREGKIRIISARDQNKKERRLYEKN